MIYDPLNNPDYPVDDSPAEREENIPSSKLGHLGTFADTGPELNLSNVQFRAIELALQGLRDPQIAKTLSLSRKTLYRWKTQNADYRQALADARLQLHQAAADRCGSIALSAASVLYDFLKHSDDKHRLRAAQILLTAAARFKPPASLTRPPNSRHPPPPPEFIPEPQLEPKVG